MAILSGLSNMAKNIGDKANEALETQKLNSKINAEKSAIDGVYNKIGEYYYQIHKSGKKLSEEAAALCAVIDGHNAAIDEAEAEIERIKAQNAAASAPSGGGIACQSCGTVNAPDRKFCQDCGAKLEAPVSPAATNGGATSGASGGGIACPSCGTANAPDRKFCQDCGAKLKSGAKTAPALVEGVCPSCGNTNPPGTKFCRECGAKL